MVSIDDIKNELQNIADKYKMEGESLDVIIDFLAYTFYHEQIEITNVAKEKSLNTAVLMNSKITTCMDYMYSVYRGRNPYVEMNLVFNSVLARDKFDLLYEANKFKVYAAEAMNYAPTVGTNDDTRVPTVVTGIITTGTVLEYVPEITASNRYYIDVKTNLGNLASNLSEHIYVYRVNQATGLHEEFPTTRMFLDHCRSLESENMIFVLTIPDYGVRLFRKGYWRTDEEIHIKVIPYCVLDDIETTQLQKITIPGTQQIGEENYYQQGVTLSADLQATSYKLKVYKEVARDEADTLTYQANFAGRASSTILCNNDVHYLFQEVFKDKVQDSVYDLVLEEGNEQKYVLNIYYISREYVYEITDEEKQSFIDNYGSYFITQDVNIVQAEAVPVSIALHVVANENTEVISQVQAILDKYAYQLGIQLNPKLINAEIAKLDQIYYIDQINYSITEEQMSNIKPNQYYTFSVTMSYKSKLNETSFDFNTTSNGTTFD